MSFRHAELVFPPCVYRVIFPPSFPCLLQSVSLLFFSLWLARCCLRLLCLAPLLSRYHGVSSLSGFLECGLIGSTLSVQNCWLGGRDRSVDRLSSETGGRANKKRDRETRGTKRKGKRKRGKKKRIKKRIKSTKRDSGGKEGEGDKGGAWATDSPTGETRR